MTATITLDGKARGSFRRFGLRARQVFTVKTDGQRLILEPAKPRTPEERPAAPLAKMRRKGGLLVGPGKLPGSVYGEAMRAERDAH